MFGSKAKEREREAQLKAYGIRLENMETMLLQTVQQQNRQPQITITQEIDYRPCYVNGRRALWHRWVNTARPQLPKGQEPGENARYFQFRNTHALVEYEDGTMDLVWPRDIQFADHGHFEDYAWTPQEGLTNG